MKTKVLVFSLLMLATGGSLFAQVPVPIVAGVVTADVGRNSNFKIIVNQIVTSVVLSSSSTPSPGQYVTLFFTENATGGFAVTFGGNISNPCTVTTTANATTNCSFQYDSTSNTWFGVAGGSSSSTSNPAPNMGFYLTNACLVANTGNCFFTNADTQQFNDGSWTNASTTLTFASSHFGAGQALVNPTGFSVMGFKSCANDLSSVRMAGGEIAPNAAMPTVVSFTATTLVISATPANTQALVSAFPQGGCVVLGHPDDSGASAIDAALQASPSCPKLFQAAANYLFRSPHFFTNPTACANIGPGIGGNFGDTTLSAGFEIEGRGVGATAWYLSTDFPNGDTCQHIPTGAGNLSPLHVGACFAIPVMGKWADFRIDGGGQGAPTGITSKTLGPYMAVGTLMNWSCVNYGAFTGGTAAGIELSLNNSLYQVNNSGCGDTGIYVDAGAVNNVAVRTIIENSSVASIYIGGPNAIYPTIPEFVCYWCILAAPSNQPLGAFPMIRNAGGNIKLIGTNITTCNGNLDCNASTNTGIDGYQCLTTANCVAYFDAVTFYGFVGSGTTNSSVRCLVACTNYFLNTTFVSQASGVDIADVAGSLEYDLGGNTPNSPQHMSISGRVINSPSIATAPLVAGNLVPSANWGTGAAVSAPTGNATNFSFTLTNGSAAVGASPTIAFAFPLPTFWVAPSKCSVWQVGGTQAVTATTVFLAPSALSATGVTLTYNGTPTANLTEFYQGSCTN